jgi:hypothetical protein
VRINSRKMINGEITINLKEGFRTTEIKGIFFMIILEYNGLIGIGRGLTASPLPHHPR